MVVHVDKNEHPFLESMSLSGIVASGMDEPALTLVMCLSKHHKGLLCCTEWLCHGDGLWEGFFPFAAEKHHSSSGQIKRHHELHSHQTKEVVT